MPLFSDTGSVATATNQSSSSTALTSVVSSFVAANPDRKGLRLRNTGANTAFIGFDNTVTSTVFYQSIPSGQSYEFPVAYTGAIWGICAATRTTNIAITEFTS
jgi:hypothetical protein